MADYGSLVSAVSSASSLERNSAELRYGKYSDEQRACILSPLNKSAVVYAGAGAGKTTVLIERVAKILRETGVSPDKVAVITFTTKAAAELKHRLQSKLGGTKTGLPYCGTVHALAYKLLSAKRGEAVPILSPEAETMLVSAFKAELGDEVSDFTPQELLTLLSRCREEDDYASTAGIFAGVYQERLDSYDIMDFTALLVNASQSDWSAFDYILVDESQDLSKVQRMFIHKLGHAKTKYWFIGDDDQAIYAFRGAGSGVMADLVKEFGTHYVLSTNFRSDRKIVQHALNVIEFNEDRVPIKWKAHSQDEGTVSVRKFELEQQELDAVIQFLQENPGAVALARTQQLIMELRAMKLPAMTVHESKGLEFDKVWILGCEAALFPHPLSLKEEERRLFYVAMTRAKHDLICSYALSRNAKNKATRHVSPFLFEAQTLTG